MIGDLGFSGSQTGMTGSQAVAIIKLLRQLNPKRVHHGNCVGADEQLHFIVQSFFRDIELHVHEATISEKQAGCKGNVHYPPAPPLNRNHDIVNCSDVMCLTPGQAHEVQRSGTWATIRYTRKQNMRHFIILPNGNEHEA